MSALARWCYKHRLLVVLLWVALLAGVGLASTAAGTKASDSFSLPGTESSKALELLQETMPAQSGATATVVWESDGNVRDAAVKDKMTATLDELAKIPEVAAITSPYSEQGARQISEDGRVAYASVNFTEQAMDLDKANLEKFVDTAEEARGDGLKVELGGDPISQAAESEAPTAELVGIAAAAIVLFVAFGSLFAMLLPIATAVAGVGVGLMTVTLLTHVMSIGEVGPILGALIGLGVGIDYALFIVTRHRANLKSGMEMEASVVKAIDTSGRAVLFAGGTVVVALFGLFVLGVDFLNGMAVASATAVVFTVLAAVTLLPALLGFIGMRVLSRRERRAQSAAPETRPGVWARWAVIAERRRVVLSVLSLAVVTVLSLPVLSLRLGSSDAGNHPADTTTRKAYDMLAEGFGPGFNGPLQLVAETPNASDRQALETLATQLSDTEGVAAVTVLPAEPDAKVGIVQVVPTTSPQSEQTAELIQHLRDDVIPPAEKDSTLQVYVGGQTAIFDDFAEVLTGKLPLFLTVIVALGCVLLLLAFRSLMVPLVAAVMNILATAASFGVIVAFFQYGWGSERLGWGAAGPVEAFLPVIMLSVLFGLSMDYQVFLVSRMHEEWIHTRDNKRAVAVGMAETGRVITAAATIMFCVFIAFSFGGERIVAEFGIGLAAAVAIDAFVLRTVLVPATMYLLGKANWWIPAWLDKRLPHLSVEGPAETAQEDRQPEPVSR
ncbi:MMPL family transporter [Streptomyces ipomoeae]|uniref:MMPL family transporter n=1 Tax=Streptomyces ipomoeae TaxID=103232 RepID=UPI001146225A|nr:MMPL family transporter [Streptomyces ipomoeae]MDX2937194.1 MMPL family transporter [Streptomyces ipomoeae]TQE28555.1 MMPL family transporter [Streptomyces ipomoeae]